MRTEHQKLVRDKIPKIIENAGKTAVCHQLSEEEYQIALDKKLLEEVQEYQGDHLLEEMADVLEVLLAICNAQGYTVDDLFEKRRQKAEERGGFAERIFLEYVEQ